MVGLAGDILDEQRDFSFPMSGLHSAACETRWCWLGESDKRSAKAGEHAERKLHGGRTRVLASLETIAALGFCIRPIWRWRGRAFPI